MDSSYAESLIERDPDMDRDMMLEQKTNTHLSELQKKGAFQLFAFAAIYLGLGTFGFYVYQFGYLFQQPAYVCTYTSDNLGDLEQICTVENICAEDPRIASY